MRPGKVPPPRLSDFNYPTHFRMADGKVFHSPNKFQIASLSRPVHILAGNKSFWAINLQVSGARPRTEWRKNICSRRCTQIAKELARGTGGPEESRLAKVYVLQVTESLGLHFAYFWTGGGCGLSYQ